MIRILKAECYKTKHTWLPLIHVVIPIVYALCFFIAVKVTGLKFYEPKEIIQNYLMILGAVLPIIIGAITSKVVEIEANAGHFQVLLSSTYLRSKVYMGKLLVLLIGAFGSIILSVFLFGILFGHQTVQDLFIEALLIFISCMATYAIHLVVAIFFGGGASLGLGFVEMLLALLLILILGDDIWYFVPCTWPSRLSGLYCLAKKVGFHNAFLYHELYKWLVVAVPITIIIFVSSAIWFTRWEGQSYTD
ncbi:lantibiotic immunity ABC transporter MutG family permease subunit [Atopobacter phocae]|uniref:lantibiotic immunity ABC transporter MutG family permease subunit n=1 Tax=Atopobacter phocae TaxID=136492 RepID=UPI00047049F0|nr:lantibiotic immunity ABC transporter MutG family permease subunit [Atopobacter phocae]